MKDRLLSFFPFYRWHPEVAIRYLPLIGEIEKLGRPSVLEIGSGGLGIAPYLSRRVTGLDTNFAPPFHPLLEQKTGSVLAIPFAPKSFDVVIAVDALEHIDRKNRKQAIDEMLRVAAKEVIIAVPTGKESQEQDEELNLVYQKMHGRPYPYLKEQIGFGLPEISEIKSLLGDNVRMEQNEPLALRRFLMLGWMGKGIVNKIIYWKLLLLVLPLFSFWRRPPYYRTIFYKKV